MITNLMKEDEDDKLKRVIVRGVVSIIRSVIFDDDDIWCMIYGDDDDDDDDYGDDEYDDDTCNSGHNDKLTSSQKLKRHALHRVRSV